MSVYSITFSGTISKKSLSQLPWSLWGCAITVSIPVEWLLLWIILQILSIFLAWSAAEKEWQSALKQWNTSVHVLSTPRLIFVVSQLCWALPRAPNATVSNGSGLRLGLELNRLTGFYHMKSRIIAIGPVLAPQTRHLNRIMLSAIKYLSSDLIVTWSISPLCSFGRSFTCRLQICDLTNTHGFAIKNPGSWLRICPYFRATQQLSVGS